MTHISSNACQIIGAEIDYYHFVTWNDEGLGEYCLWRLCKDGKFEYSTRCVVHKWEKSWLEKEDSPRNFILDMQFSSREGKLSFVVRKENNPKKSENGIGLQMLKLEPQSEEKDLKIWYQVVESFEQISCVKWTNTLLLGTAQAAAIFVKGRGLYELVDCCFGSEFQAFYDTLKEECCNFVQVGRYRRFWISVNGTLRVMVVQPQMPSNHPEWNELFKPANAGILINMKILGRRIGYSINDLSKDQPNVATSGQRKGSTKKSGDSSPPLKLGEGKYERYCGFHLYRCWACKRPLLKPLGCSRCLTVVYCSKVCQQNDWVTHRPQCQPKT